MPLHIPLCLANLKISPFSGWPALSTEPVSQAEESNPEKLIRTAGKRWPVERGVTYRTAPHPRLALSKQLRLHTPTPGKRAQTEVLCYFSKRDKHLFTPDGHRTYQRNKSTQIYLAETVGTHPVTCCYCYSSPRYSQAHR